MVRLYYYHIIVLIKHVSYSGSGSTSADCDAATKALDRCSEIIVESTIDPLTLARKLYSDEIISEDVFKRVKDPACRDTNDQRRQYILDDIMDRVKRDADTFTKFVNILRKKFKRDDLADEIMSNLN